jgi:hypothetical protein
MDDQAMVIDSKAMISPNLVDQLRHRFALELDQ